ncbi:MAG TPA: sulfite exporter TauE/SafE family protein [Vicinamibacterales bacterium]
MHVRFGNGNPAEGSVELTLVVVGAATGFVVGMTSTGGGALLTPALVLLADVPARVAIGSDVLIASTMKLASGGFYAWRAEVHWPTVLRLLAGSAPGALAGLAVVNRLPIESSETILRAGLGVVLVLAGAAIAFRLRSQAIPAATSFPAPLATAAIGFIVGLLVSLTSIGSGSLLLCALGLWFPLGARTTVGTDLLHALALSALVSAGHWSGGRVDPAVVGAVLVGAVPGSLAGAMAATAVPQRALRVVLATVLVAIGVQLTASSVTALSTATSAPLEVAR